jgi:hypothetical protein
VSQSGSQQQPQQPLLVRRRAKLVLTPLALACPWQSAFVHSATHAETANLVLFAKADDLVDDRNYKARCKVCRIVAPDGHECAVSLFRHATLKLKHDYKRTKAFSKIAQSLLRGRGALSMAHPAILHNRRFVPQSELVQRCPETDTLACATGSYVGSKYGC